MKTFREIREGGQITKSKFYKDRDRKGHEGRLYAIGVKWTDVEKAIIQSLKANRGTKAHMSSFDGLSSNPKEVEVMGDMKALVSIADKIGKKGKVKVDKNPWESVEEGLKEVTIGDAGIRKDFPNVWATKDKKLYDKLRGMINDYGFTTNLKAYKKDPKKFIAMLKGGKIYR